MDGTALVFTKLDTLERFEEVAHWALLLHLVQARPEALPSELRWLRHLDDDDRGDFFEEMWEALAEVRAGEGLAVFREALNAWQATARSLADGDRRGVLLGAVSEDDFIVAERPS